MNVDDYRCEMIWKSWTAEDFQKRDERKLTDANSLDTTWTAVTMSREAGCCSPHLLCYSWLRLYHSRRRFCLEIDTRS